MRPNPNRNTLGDQYRPIPRPITNSVQRRTMTNPHNQPRQLTTQQNTQKIAATINSALLRLPSQGTRSSISNSLQPKASTMISTISTFLNSIDHNYQKNCLEIQALPTILNFWGYPHTYNKSVFQPIGAPHTWYACLQMIQFFAEIAIYFFQYRLQFDQYKLDTEEIDLVLEAFARNDTAEYEMYLDRVRAGLCKEEEDLAYKIQSSELTLRNIKNSQRSVSQLQVQQQLLNQKLQRESQTVIQLDQKNTHLLSQIQTLDDHISQLSQIKSSLLQKITMLQQQITTQQLSYQQASKIQYDIKQYNTRIRQLQGEIQGKKREFQIAKNGIVEGFYRVVEEVNQIRGSVRKYEAEVGRRGVEGVLGVPGVDHVAFAEGLHCEDLPVFLQVANRIIEGDKIKQMLISQQSLSDILQLQLKQLTSQLAQQQILHTQTDSQNKSLHTQLTNLTTYKSQLTAQLAHLSQILQKTSQTIQSLKKQSNRLKNTNQQLLRREIQLTQNTKKIRQNLQEGVRMFKKFEEQIQGDYKVAGQREGWVLGRVGEVLGRVGGGFGVLNQGLEGLL